VRPSCVCMAIGDRAVSSATTPSTTSPPSGSVNVAIDWAQSRVATAVIADAVLGVVGVDTPSSVHAAVPTSTATIATRTPTPETVEVMVGAIMSP